MQLRNEDTNDPVGLDPKWFTDVKILSRRKIEAHSLALKSSSWRLVPVEMFEERIPEQGKGSAHLNPSIQDQLNVEETQD